MNHPGAPELDPAGTFAWAAAFAFELPGTVTSEAREIELSRRLCKREIRRAKSRPGVFAVHSFEPFGNSAFEVRHRDAFVDAQALELVEHRRVRHIWRVASIDAAG